MSRTPIDLQGKMFGRLKVLEMNGRDRYGRVKWKCICECGNETTVDSRHLKSGATSSCGCLQKEKVKERMTTHGLTKGYKKLINVWWAMVSRCADESNSQYHNYGGRGIMVCDEWKSSFENFYKWAMGSGYSEALTIDRINNDGNYEPDNCRWVDMVVQNNNRRDNVLYTIGDETKTLTLWCRYYNMSYDKVRGRLRLGWDIEKALEIKKLVH